MTRHLWLLCSLAGPFCLLAGPLSLVFHTAVMEALVLVLAGAGLVGAAGVFLAAELHGPAR